MGAEIRSIKSTGNGHEYMWQGDPEYWGGTAYHLFPFVGRLFKEKYRYDGKEYRMPLHGFAYTSEFALKEKTDTAMAFELKENEKTYSAYPFRFSLTVRYELAGEKLSVGYSLKNTDEKKLYFGIGWHPGFNLPLDKGGNFEDHVIRFPNVKKLSECIFSDEVLDIGVNEKRVCDNGEWRLRHEEFLRDLRAFRNTGKRAELRADGGREKIVLEYDVPYFGVWSSRMPNSFVCVETMSMLPGRAGVVEDIESKPDIIALSPSETWRTSLSVKITES